MIIPSYTVILKYLALAAAVIALIGVPVWYLDRAKKEAYALGYSAAEAECKDEIADIMLDHTKRASAELDDAYKRIESEAARANALEKALSKARKDNSVALNQLKESLAKEPTVATGCTVNSNATSLLRSFADGNFSLKGDAVPGQLDPKVPNRTELPREGGINNTRSSGSVR